MSDTKQDLNEEDQSKIIDSGIESDTDGTVDATVSEDENEIVDVEVLRDTDLGQDKSEDTGKLTLLLEDARAKADEHWNQCLRLQADTENLRRRHERELEKAHKFALDKFTEALLPVADSLEMGLIAVSNEGADLEKLKEGSELTMKMLKSVLDKFEIKEINPVGEAFNPELHQAMTMQESDKVTPNTVLTVFQKGYLLHDRLIRPARVVVAKAAENKTAEGSEQQASILSEPGEDTTTNSTESRDSLGSQIDEKA